MAEYKLAKKAGAQVQQQERNLEKLNMEEGQRCMFREAK